MYEGQTQFWGYVVQARSGIVSKEDTLDQLAAIYATYDAWRGRDWRPMGDTVNDPIISARRPKGWPSWQRSEDYYNEGLLIWLEADATIRRLSNGARSMDDFAAAFFRARDGDYGVRSYTFDDVVTTLNSVVAHDWREFLDARVNRVNPRAPLAGFTANGYDFTWVDTPPPTWKERERIAGNVNLVYSGGLTVANDGAITAVLWGSPAFDAKLDVDDRITAIGDRQFSAAALREAVTAAKGTRQPIRLTVANKGRLRQVDLAWNGGLRYPKLRKSGAGDTGLDRLLAPR